MNKKWQLDSPIFVHAKKHDCPACGQQLTVKRVNRVINSKSEEAKDFDFAFSGDGFLSGDVEFSFEVFFCDACDKEYSIKEMKAIERGQSGK